MRRFFLTTACVCAPLSAMAQSQLDRFEDLAADMNIAMFQMMANDIDAAGGNGDLVRDAIPDEIWTAEMRDAGACMLEGYAKHATRTDIDAMLTHMEDLLPTLDGMTMDTFAQTVDPDAMLPDGLTSDMSAEISVSCGMIALQMDAMEESGFTQAMMAASASIPGNN